MSIRRCLVFLLSLGFLILNPVESALMAQSSEWFFFGVKLSPDNEVPRITGQDGVNGSGRIKVKLTRDASGNITSGTAEFVLAVQFLAPVTITGLHLHSGGVGENGPVVIDSDLTEITEQGGMGSIDITTPTLTSPGHLSVLAGLIETPQLYYVDLHTSNYPNGAIRGQTTNKRSLLSAKLSPKRVVPSVAGLDAIASVLVTIDVTRGASGNTTSGSVLLDAEYRFPNSVTLSALQIHSGQAGQNGAVVIDLGPLNIASGTGTGKVTKIISLPTDTASLNTLEGLGRDPDLYYVEISTTDHPQGAMRGQLSGFSQQGLIAYSRDDEGCRSNLGIQNLTNVPTPIEVFLLNRKGELMSTRTVFVSARGLTQLLRINALFGNKDPDSTLYLSTDVPIEAFVSMIDNTTNFPTMIPFALRGSRQAVASVTNVGKFRSSLVIANAGSEPATVDIVFRNTNGEIIGKRTGLMVSPLGFFSSEDILSELGVVNSFGPLEVFSTNEQPIAVVSRVYNATDNRGGLLSGRVF